MFELAKLAIFPALFALGFFLKKTNLANSVHADLVLKLVIYLIMPTLIIGSVSTLTLSKEWLVLPICAGIIVLFAWPCAWVLGKRTKLKRKTQATFIIATMIMNLSVIFPFVSIIYAREAVAMLALFDFGHGLLVLTLVYGIAGYYGRERFDPLTLLKNVVLFPPNMAMLFALWLNLSGIANGTATLPVILEVFYHFGKWGILLVLVALGIYFRFDIYRPKLIIFNIFSRVIVGLIAALTCVWLFNIDGLMKHVIILASIAPVGFNTLIFSMKEGLDKQHAANTVSISMLLAFFYLPVLVFFEFL